MKKMVVVCFCMMMVLLLSGCDVSAIAEKIDFEALAENETVQSMLESEAVQDLVQSVAEQAMDDATEEAVLTQEATVEQETPDEQVEEEEEDTSHTDVYRYYKPSSNENAKDLFYFICLHYYNEDGSDGVGVEVMWNKTSEEVWGRYNSPSDFGSTCYLTSYTHNEEWGTINWLSISGDTLTASVTRTSGDTPQTDEYTFTLG